MPSMQTDDMPIPELDVLKPADPALSNTDDWEIFVLSDAHVVYESNGKSASLLAAYADTPLKVEGRLEGPGRGQAKCFLKKAYKPIDVEVRNVTRFSYGETTDGTYVLWAQGKAGWFEIQPAPRYRPIFDQMLEAVGLLYFITDVYGERRKKTSGPSAQLLFQEYAEDKRFACTDPALAEQIFHRHHVFLLMCFLNREQSVGWSNTSIYQCFKKRHLKDFDTCKARIEGRYTQIQTEKLARNSKSSPVASSKSGTTASKSQTARRQAATPGSNPPPKKDDNWWEAAALFEFMQKAVNQRALRAGRNLITLSRVAELIIKRYEIEELETAQNVLLVHAQNLCYMMDHPRRKTVQYFASEPIYQELSAGHNLSAVEQRRTEGVELRPRKDHAPLRDGNTDSSDTSDGEEEDAITTPTRPPPGRRRKGRLSVLRPGSSRYSGKSKGIRTKSGKGQAGKGKAPAPDSETPSDDMENEDSKESSSSGNEMGIDTPTHVLSPGREKRKLKETDADEEEAQSRRKRAASASITPDSPPAPADLEDEDASAVPSLPLRYRPTNGLSNSKSASNTSSTIIAPIVSTPLPTYESNGPRDSWICNFDGCSQRIYGCSKERGQLLITEHLEDHTKGREKVVGILWREQDKLHLPVSNLIKKIREMSEATTPLFPMSSMERALPQPIQRPV